MKKIGKQKFAELVTEYRQCFYRIAYSYVKSEQDALEIVSEATYKGFIHLEDLRKPEYFKTWMTRIVINSALELLRKRTYHSSFTDCIGPEALSEPPDLDIQYDLYAALDSLGAEDKSYVILKYFEGYSFREIADILKTPESTVKSRLYRCLGKMREYMEGDDVC